MGMIFLALLLILTGLASLVFGGYRYRKKESYRAVLAAGILLSLSGLALILWFLSAFG